MPVVKNGEFGGDYTASTALEALATGLDLRTQVEPPFGVGTRRVEDGCDIIFQYNGSEETNVDVSGQLEDVVVLPVLIKSASHTGTVFETFINLPSLFLVVECVPVSVFAVLVDGLQ